MKTWIDFEGALVYAIPAIPAPAWDPPVCEGMLIEGPQGWGEFSPPDGVDDRRAARWLTAAIEVGTVGWPDPVRGRVPVAVSVPRVDPDQARHLVTGSGCRAAVVHVGGPRSSPSADIARLEAVREALGPGGAVRCDAGGGWDVRTAVAVLPELDRAAGGLEFAQDPCRGAAENRAVRGRLSIRIAIRRALCDAADPRAVDLTGAADVAVLSAAALGGVRRAMRIAEVCDLPCVVAADPRSSIATAGELALAGVLPDSGFAHELGGLTLLDGDVVSAARSLIPADAALPVAPMPPAPDLERLGRLPAPDPGRVQTWRARLAAVQRLI